MALPPDYTERVYAGVLGKIIGVYLGRPFEGWTYERITAELGDVNYYVHERRGKPLVVTDDDISGTFTFLRALPDHDNARDLTPAQIGQTWLNYIVEGRTILWWGGLGNSTEHTAYLRLKGGVPAPRSGSKELNGTVVSEQIGAQIFVDGWAMVAPGDPELAADLARRAASVSHDGEAVYGAQVVAAMEAQAFAEPDLNRLVDTALRFIPADSVIARLIYDVRAWHAADPDDWRMTRAKIAATYGYDTYGGGVHVVPNHALIHLGLFYGGNDFQRALMITNTSGWDTDCNAGNVGCLLGIKNGLSGIEAGPDWRGPVADRLYLPTADGGRAITDAVIETYHVVNSGRALAGDTPLTPKGGARFHFELPGSVQGFQVDHGPDARGVVALENVAGHSCAGARSLALRYTHLAVGRVGRVSTPTFIPPDVVKMSGYTLLASPTLYPGQDVRAAVATDADNGATVTVRLRIQAYGADDVLIPLIGPEATLEPGSAHEFTWRIPDTGGAPIASIGLELAADRGASGTVYLDYLAWDGAPDVTFGRPTHGGTMWRRAWMDGIDQAERWYPEAYRLMQNRGRGLWTQGTREWTDYTVTADVSPHLVVAAGLAARVQGMRRYYALLLCGGGTVRLVKALDGDRVLGEADLPWEPDRPYTLSIEVIGFRLRAWIDGHLLFDVEDFDHPLLGGGVALLCEEGRVSTDTVTIRPTGRG
jgi:ADP-ribosylglycohydrolase